MRLLILTFALLALAACQETHQQPTNEPAAEAEGGPVKGADRSHKGKPAPDVSFKDSEGGDITLAEFAGAPVLVNLWATWCAPCVNELPTLERLSQSRGQDGVLVVAAISQDTAPHASVEAFLRSHRINNLAAYQDSKMALSRALGAEVLPTSILYDAQGREVWRFVGDLDWMSPEAAKLLAEAGVTSAR